MDDSNDLQSFDNISTMMMSKVSSRIEKNINNDLIDNTSLYYKNNEIYSTQTQQSNENNSKQFKRKRRTAQSNVIVLHDIIENETDDLDNNNSYNHSSYGSSYHYHGKVWNEEMDLELITNINNDVKDWKVIADRINQKCNKSITSSHVCKRWNQHLSPEVSNMKVGPWTEQEIIMLQSLVDSCSRETASTKSLCKWDVISKTLNRRYYDCQNKWNTIKKSNLKVGRFTEEEDHIITQTLLDWSIRGVKKGLWMYLESILHRRNDVIRNRWKHVLSKKCISLPICT